MADFCELFGAEILCSCICPCNPGHSVPINLQQDKCYSQMCNFLISMQMESVTRLMARTLRMGYPVYFRLYSFSDQLIAKAV